MVRSLFSFSRAVVITAGTLNHLVKRKREYQFLTNEANERVTKRPRIETSQPPEIMATNLRQQQRRVTSPRAKTILRSILDDYPFPRARISQVLEQLQSAGEEEWTEKRIQTYWKNHRNTLQLQ